MAQFSECETVLRAAHGYLEHLGKVMTWQYPRTGLLHNQVKSRVSYGFLNFPHVSSHFSQDTQQNPFHRCFPILPSHRGFFCGRCTSERWRVICSCCCSSSFRNVAENRCASWLCPLDHLDQTWGLERRSHEDKQDKLKLWYS